MRVEIWSDIACPWCYVGKRRFEAALARFDGREEVEVVWRSFELDPSAPASYPTDLADHLAAKYGRTREQALEMQRTMTGVAAAEGLAFRFDVGRGGSTFDAHRLIHHAAGHGLQDAMKERLLRAYLCEGEQMSDHEALTRLAVEVGLDEDAVRDVLASDAHAEAVRTDEREARALGITAVPCFVVDRRFGASGAQPPDELLALLEQGVRAPVTDRDVLASGGS